LLIKYYKQLREFSLQIGIQQKSKGKYALKKKLLRRTMKIRTLLINTKGNMLGKVLQIRTLSIAFHKEICS